MADENSNENGAEATAQSNEAAQAPGIHVLVQYIKDFSFENPNAPMSLSGDVSKNSKINIGVNVQATPLSETDFEVVLQIEASAKDGETVIFNAELYYGAVFKIIGVDADAIHPMVMIECPRILFPFARRIVSDAIRDGGFPPLMIDPIDFAALYRDNVLANAEVSEANGKSDEGITAEGETKQ